MSSNPEIRPPATWASRNTGTIFGGVCLLLLGLVIFAQVGC
jgi:hypothetical protein